MAERRIPKLENMEAVAKPEFTPTKNYSWESTEKFVITGLELDKLNRALVTQTGDAPDFQKFLWIQEGLMVVNNILKEGFEQGLIKEVVPKTEKPVILQPVKEVAQEKEVETKES